MCLQVRLARPVVEGKNGRHLGLDDATVEGLGLKELPSAEICCGFGGTFCVKYPDISERMAADKADDVTATYKDGVLEVRMPIKKVETPVAKVPISKQ